MIRISLRAALLCAFTLGCCAPVAVFWLWPHSALLERELRDANDNHAMIASALAQEVGAFRDYLAHTFTTHVASVADGSQTQMIETLFAPMGFLHLCVAEFDGGRVVRDVDTGGGACPEAVPAARLELIKAGLEKSETFMSGAQIVSGGAAGMLIARRTGPLLVIGAIDGAPLRRLAARIRVGDTGHAVIVDGAGRALAHPAAAWADERRDLSAAPVVAALQEGRAGVSEFVSLMSGETMRAASATVPGSDWGVFVAQPLAELQGKVDAVAASAIVTLLVGLGLSVVIALAVAHFLGQPIRAVSEAARRMAEGDHKARVAMPASGHLLGELHSLSSSFNLMAKRIERAHWQVRMPPRASAGRRAWVTWWWTRRLEDESARRESSSSLRASPRQGGAPKEGVEWATHRERWTSHSRLAAQTSKRTSRTASAASETTATSAERAVARRTFFWRRVAARLARVRRRRAARARVAAWIVRDERKASRGGPARGFGSSTTAVPKRQRGMGRRG